MLTDSMQASIDVMETHFPSQYSSPEQVQSYMDQEEYRVYKIDSSIKRYLENMEKDKEQHQVKAKALQVVNEYIPILEYSISNAQSDELILDLKDQLKGKKKEQIELEEWMRKNNANSLINDEVNYELNKVNLEYRKAICLRLGEWFAAGGAGKGTVTFMDQEYTAS